MRKINFIEHILPHLAAVIIFLIVTIFFFNPVFFDNKSISQHDIQQWEASSKSLRDYREATGEEGLWATSIFSGMPAYLVNLEWSNGIIVGIKKIFSVGLPHPVVNIYWAFLSYYILLLAFRVRPMLAIAGALAFGLSSYMIIGIAAGHNARVGAIAFMPLVMAGIHLAFRNKRLLGFAVTALGLSMHLRENHLQMTYYLLLIVLVYGLIHLLLAIREKSILPFFKNLGVLIPAALLAVGTFIGPLWAIGEYSEYSIRGKSELPSQEEPASGLSRDYAFAYSSGMLESITVMIPNFYGGSSSNFLVQDEGSATYKALMQSGDGETANQLARYTSAYWGPQSLTAPYYGGAIMCFLFVVGIVFADKKYVWWLVSVSVLGMMFSWGSNFEGFNYFVFDYLPGYNKFRSVTFAIIILLFSMPLLGMLGLEKFFEEGLNQESKKKLIIAFGFTGGLCLLIWLLAGMASFTREGESQLPAWFLNALIEDRKGLLRADAFRSFAFILGVFILLFFDVRKRISEIGFYAFLIFMVAMDMSLVDRRYFSIDNYQRKRTANFVATAADQEVMKDKSVFRVYNLQEPFSQEGSASYFHNSLGGYHGAKLRRYQDLYENCLGGETNEFISDAQAGNLQFANYGVLNMLNTKYIMFGPDKGNIIPNPEANGNAWFVSEVVNVNSPSEELAKVCEVNTRTTAVIDNSKFKIQSLAVDSLASIELVEMTPPYLKYQSSSSTGGLVVFSEIYYPKGWVAAIDGEEVPILRANYVLRALEVPAGKHQIEFKFEPKPYVIGDKITMASSWVLLLVVLGSIGWTLRKEE
ncbi:MAG TPA: YfhO family protein [Cyclobacteriaceae bacterium]|nr:YfhO family protein [Cyclobacteriaceae bacterium]